MIRYAITFTEVEDVYPPLSIWIMPPEQIIKRAEWACIMKGHEDPDFVRINYRDEVVEFWV